MRLVIQRVNSASVENTKTKKIVGKINKGLFVLVGIGREDSPEEADMMAEKLVKMRIMSDQNNKMNLSVKDSKSQILAVSQFTLYSDTQKGNRPSFIKAALPDKAKKIYDRFIKKLESLNVDTQTGEFGAYMKIRTVLDGPVTIVL